MLALSESNRRIVGQPADTPLTIDDRSRLVDLGLQVLTYAAVAAEAQCRRILEAAEAQASAIIQEAHEDVERLTSWLDAGTPDGDRPTISEPRPLLAKEAAIAASEAAAPLEPGLPSVPESHWPGSHDHPSGDEIGEEFFRSFPATDEDRWDFMDDELVGVGPAILRRVLRRQTTSRQPHLS